MADKSDAYLDGWFAHKNGESQNGKNNPYNENTQARSHNQWLAGWCARFSASKHGNSLTYDNALCGD